MEVKKKEEYLIYGLWPVVEAIKEGKEINKILIQKGLEGNAFSELRKTLKGSTIPLQMVPSQKMDKLVKAKHQGVIAIISPVKYRKLDELVPFLLNLKENPKILVLDHITDVRNFGAIARTAECTGYDAIVVPAKGAALVTPDAIRTSAGALFKIPVSKVDNLRDTLDYLSDNEISIYVCTEKTDTLIHDCDFEGPIAIVMGAEDKGVSKDLINRSHYQCKIPMQGEIASLNVAVAAGIIMYETVR